MGGILRIIEVEPTVLFSNSEPMKQLAYLKIRNFGEQDIPVKIRVDAESADESQVSEEIVKPGDNSIDIWIPDIEKPTFVSIRAITGDGTVAAIWEALWEPQRKWKVHVIKSTHYDLGYDGRVDHMQAQAAEFMDLAKRLCTDKAQLHEWHYHLEHMGFIRAYERERKESELRGFVENYLKPGYMTLLGNPSGPHWHWMDYEQIARASYPARREMMDRFGLDVRSVAIVDNPSGSWAAYQAFAQSGFRYVFRLANHFRAPGSFRDLKLPKVFRVIGPNSKDSILCYLTEFYGEELWIGQAGGGGGKYVWQAARGLSDYLRKVESGDFCGEYPYDTLIVSNYVDWDIPHEDQCILAKWSEEWRYPEIHFDDAGEALGRLEEKYGSIIPVLRGDTNNNSGDYSSIDPFTQGLKRRSARLLPFAEGLHAIAARLAPEIQYPGRKFNELYFDLVEYDEHCWPTMLPGSDMNIFNTNVVKTHKAQKIHSKVTELVKEPIGAIQGGSIKVSCSEGDDLYVWNPLAHMRSDLAKFRISSSLETLIRACKSLVVKVSDKDTAESYPAQLSETGEIVFVASDVPAYGYKAYSVNFTDMGDKEENNSSDLRATEDSSGIILQNKFYRLAVGKKDGRVLALEDRRLNRSLIDPKAPHAFNQWLRVSTGEFTYNITSKELTIRPIGKSTAHFGQVGSVMAQIVVETEDQELGARILTTYTLYEELDRLDISNKALRMEFLHTPVKDRYKENIFVAFPFDIDKPKFQVEHSTGTIDPGSDLLPSVRDFMILNRWVDVSNEDFGVTMVSHEAAAVHLGKIMYNRFSADYKPEKSYIYSYAWSNRMAGLTALQPEDYRAEISYSIRSHEGGWLKGNAAGFGWGQASPLLGVAISPNRACNNLSVLDYRNSRSFIDIDCENVQLTVLKRAEKPGKGFILRVVETEGRSCPNVKIKAGYLQADKAWLCDMVENDARELVVTDGIIELPVDAYDMATIRVAGKASRFAGIRSAWLKALGDSQIELDWEFDGETVEDAAEVNIYRSEDPGFIPTIKTLTAYVQGKQYIDSDLKPGCVYYYYIAPADRENGQGELYGPYCMRTTLENKTPPSAVEDLGVIPMDVDRLTVFWRRNEEPDVALYKVYRGDHPDFDATDENLAAEVEPDKYWYQSYTDKRLDAGTTRYYKVLPVDYAGNVQKKSDCVSGSTPKRKRMSESRY